MEHDRRGVVKIIIFLVAMLFSVLLWLTIMVFADNDFYDYANEIERDTYWNQVEWAEIADSFQGVEIEIAHVAWYEDNADSGKTLWWCEQAEGRQQQMGPMVDDGVLKLKGRRCIIRAPKNSRKWHVERSQLAMIEPLSNMEMILKHVSLRISNDNTPYNMIVSEHESMVKGLVDFSDSPHKWTIHMSQSQLVPYHE